MRTLVALSLFVAGCLAQSGVPGSSFTAPGISFPSSTNGFGSSFPSEGQPAGVVPFGTGVVGTGQPGVTTVFQPGMTPGVGAGFQPGMQPGMTTGIFQPGMSPTGTFLQPGMTATGAVQPGMTTGVATGMQPGMVQPGVATGTFQPGVGITQPGFNTIGGTFQPGGPGTGIGQPGATMLQPGMTTTTGGINPAIQTQFITQSGQTTSGFGTMGPFGSTAVPGSTGFVGSQFLGTPGLTPPPMPVPLTPMAALMMSLARNPNNYRYATCMLNDTSSTVKGRIDLRQFLIGEGRNMVNVRIQLAGLPQSTINVERGIHVHEFGDIGDMCSRVGPHFNPTGTPHGRRLNFAWLRHAGDLGNILQSPEGLVSTQFSDMVISLEGINNVIGRSIVITQERDDEGFGGNTDSMINGNARTPMACCTIVSTTSRNWFMPLSTQALQNMAMTQVLPDETFPQFNGGANFNMVNGGMVGQVNPGAAFGTQAGFTTGTQPQSGLGQVSFTPTATNGQSFVFASQGKKKK